MLRLNVLLHVRVENLQTRSDCMLAHALFCEVLKRMTRFRYGIESVESTLQISNFPEHAFKCLLCNNVTAYTYLRARLCLRVSASFSVWYTFVLSALFCRCHFVSTQGFDYCTENRRVDVDIWYNRKVDIWYNRKGRESCTGIEQWNDQNHCKPSLELVSTVMRTQRTTSN